MRKLITTLLIVALVNPLWSSAQFVHPGGFNTNSELDFIKQKVNSDQQPWKKAYDQMINGSYGKMSYNHKAFASVDCGSHNQPNNGCSEMVEDAMAAYSQALQWYITGDKKHADKAIAIMDAWSAKYVKNTDFNDKLVASWSAPWWVNAAEIIRYTGAGWSQAKINQMEGFMSKLHFYATTGGMFNNGFHSQIEAQFAIAIFLNDKTKYDKALSEWRKWSKTYVYLKSEDGARPLDGRRGNINEWDTQNYVDGQCQETCRDYGHAQLGVRAIVNSAAMAWSQGDDLFKEEAHRIKAFMETHGKWTLNREKVPSGICFGKGVKCTGRSNSPKMPGCGQDAYEIAYRHIHDRLGISMPITEEMIGNVRPMNMDRWNSKPETLIAAGIPFGNIVNPPNNEAPEVSFASPANNATITTGYTSLVVEANATDSDGTIAKVSLYVDGTLVRTESGAPYEWGHVSNNPVTETELLGLSAGNHVFKLVAEDDKGATSESLITVVVKEAKGPYSGTPISIPGTIEAEHFDKGGEGVSYSDTDSENKGADRSNFRINDGVDIDNGNGGKVIGWIATDEWLDYTINVTAAGKYDISFVVSSLDGDGQFSLVLDETTTLLSTIDVPFTGDWAIYTEVNETITLPKGTHTLKLKIDTKGLNVDKMVLKPTLVTATDSEIFLDEFIYPNPSHQGVFHLATEKDYKVLSITGELLLEGKGKDINLEAYPSGTYIIQLPGVNARLIK